MSNQYAMKMTPDVSRALIADGYTLPESWPANARVAPEFNSKHGWTVREVSGTRDESMLVYTAPDGSKWVKASHGARVVLVGLSKRSGAFGLRVAPGTKRPAWVITDAPKGEVPEHLRRFLLKPGQKITKGEKREVEALLVEPVTESRTTRGRAGSAVAVLGPRPKAGTPERTEWNRRYRELRKDHFAAYRAAKKSGRATARA